MNDETNIKLPDRLKNSPFSLPNGYFDSLPDCIMKKCTSETVKKRTLWQTAKPILNFAAGFLLLVGISQIIVNTVTDKKSDTTLNLAQTNTDETSIIDLYENGEITDEIEDEIITYLVDDHYISMVFIEDEYLP
ncbi:MAG: hypothetical protein LBE11_05320 [Prevotellaceae bacterium]|jgi:hypothetical protein|nr:hypothetical protein [Prevotellaceae bacterium]